MAYRNICNLEAEPRAPKGLHRTSPDTEIRLLSNTGCHKHIIQTTHPALVSNWLQSPTQGLFTIFKALFRTVTDYVKEDLSLSLSFPLIPISFQPLMTAVLLRNGKIFYHLCYQTSQLEVLDQNCKVQRHKIKLAKNVHYVWQWV